MASLTPTIHVFIVCFPIQGQVNPLLRLGKRLASIGGFLVTFSTTSHFGQHITNSTGIAPGQLSPIGNGFLRFEFFDDECARIDPRRWARHLYPGHLNLIGRKRLPEILHRLVDEGLPVSCLIYGTLLPWVPGVAADLDLPAATMWTQSCASFLSFNHYYNNLGPFPTEDDPYIDVEIPTLPRLKWDELHSFLHPATTRPHLRKAWLAEFGNLNYPFRILIDTFNDLEPDTIEFTSNLCPTITPVGPLFKDPIAASSAVRGDQLKPDFDCLRWLDGKPRGSVVYISFGSTAHLKQEQIDEIAHGILNSRAPFLWAMKPPEPDRELEPHSLPRGFLEAAGDNGRVINYGPQEEVLAHASVGCFVTHCGWNSTMEALASGVPMVAFPQWGDQLTNGKFVVDVYGVGVRMCRGEHEDRVVTREEVEECIREATVGPKAEEMRRNALVWKDMAEKAYRSGGSSDRNLRGFVDEIRRRSRRNVAEPVAEERKMVEEGASTVAMGPVI